MIARWKSILAAVTTCALLACGLSACGTGNDATAGDEGKMTLVVWASQEDQLNEDSWLQTMEQEFAKLHPEYDITWNNQVISSADAATIAKQDPTVAADVFMYASDQLGTLKEANAIARMSDDAVKQIKAQYKGSESMIQSVTGDDGYLYGAPFGGNTWFMYYRKKQVHRAGHHFAGCNARQRQGFVPPDEFLVPAGLLYGRGRHIVRRRRHRW
ncbi:ABC transporter substrate-binding protein [Bifidobacterium sp. DSM 109957]|uniref:ABC transporter substrate-binding protein n=2 Tax=Bifidobacterium oedipodis TaxID=2675322 RepID=A0A7Y0HS78_9BIFI|nr:ABC transporter substrate-binding protein [Bifidobacterium sp. DSM 109957]